MIAHPQNHAHLRLVGEHPYARILVIDIWGKSINAAVYALPLPNALPLPITLAYSATDLVDSRLYATATETCLWLGRSAFDVSSEEAQELATTLEPLGLRVVRTAGEPSKGRQSETLPLPSLPPVTNEQGISQ